MNYFNNVVIDHETFSNSMAAVDAKIDVMNAMQVAMGTEPGSHEEACSVFGEYIEVVQEVNNMKQAIISTYVNGYKASINDSKVEYTVASVEVSMKQTAIIDIEIARGKAVTKAMNEMVDIINARQEAMQESHFGTMAMCSTEEIAERMADTRAMVA